MVNITLLLTIQIAYFFRADNNREYNINQSSVGKKQTNYDNIYTNCFRVHRAAGFMIQVEDGFFRNSSTNKL